MTLKEKIEALEREVEELKRTMQFLSSKVQQATKIMPPIEKFKPIDTAKYRVTVAPKCKSEPIDITAYVSENDETLFIDASPASQQIAKIKLLFPERLTNFETHTQQQRDELCKQAWNRLFDIEDIIYDEED